MPEQDAVVAISSATMDMQTTLNRLWDILLPAMQSEALTENASVHTKLNGRLASLSHPTVDGQPDSPTAADISGRVYHFDTNDYQFSTIRLDFVDVPDLSDTVCTITLTRNGQELVIPCGFGVWLAGQMPMFNAHERWVIESAPIVTSGAWTTDDRFTLVMRYYETPFVQTLTCQFNGDTLTITLKGNVSLGGVPEPVLLTARV